MTSPSPVVTATFPDPPVADFDLTYEPLAGKRAVKQSRLVTFSHQRRISVYSKRILARVLEQITLDDQQLRPCYQLRVSAIVADTTLTEGAARSFVKQALRELALLHWEFEDPQTKEWYIRPLLDCTKEVRLGLCKGIITVVLNPQLTPYFVQISGQYTVYKLDGYMQLRSWYAMRFYEILSTFRDTGWWEVPLAEFRRLMDCGPELDKHGQPVKDKLGNPRLKLSETKDLLKHTVISAQQELAATALAFTYQPLYGERPGPGRKKIVGLRFDLVNAVPTSIPEHWFKHAETCRIIARLRSFQVSDRNIVTYLPLVRLEGAHKLIREWELKENSGQRINEKVKYCNKVLVQVGKQAQQAQQQLALDQKKEAAWAKQYVRQAFLQ